MNQKYKKGDKVWVDKLPKSMSHFYKTLDVPAIVEYSYKDKYGGSGKPTYCLRFEGHGTSSWYDEYLLRPVNKLEKVLK